MKPVKSLLAIIAVGLALSTSIAMADAHRCDARQPEQMHERIKNRLDKLAQRLEIKASQQAAWGEFAKSVEALAEHAAQKPGDDADALAISRYRAERATEFAKKLTLIADNTAKLQAALTADQQKVFNQMSQHFGMREHAWKKREGHDMDKRDGGHE